MPAAGPTPLRKRSPFPDEVARALADEANLARLAEVHDPARLRAARHLGNDHRHRAAGQRGAAAAAGLHRPLRRAGHALARPDQGRPLRPGDPHPRTAVSERLAARRETTVSRFIARHGRPPTAAERAAMALFPGRYRNPDGTAAVTYQWFHLRFKAWVDELDIGRWVAHQARHTLATSLLRHGATLTHIRRYLGHVSDRMAEHYIQLSHSDLEDVLQHVWVAGPGTASPGTLLSGPATPDHPRAGPGARDRPVAAQHPRRRRVLHLPARRRRRRLPVEPGLPQLRQLRAVRRRPALLAAQTRAVVLHRRTRPRRRHRRLPARSLRARPRPPSTGWKPPWPGSACSTTRSPWTCAAPRTTSSGSGTSGSAPPSSPAPPQTPTPSPTTSRRGRRRAGGTA